MKPKHLYLPHAWASKITSAHGMSFCECTQLTRRYQKPAENLSILLNNQNNGSMLEG